MYLYNNCRLNRLEKEVNRRVELLLTADLIKGEVGVYVCMYVSTARARE